MPLQNVNVTKLDGQVGVQLTSENVLAIIAPAASGTVNQPTVCASYSAAVAVFGQCILSELVAAHIAVSKRHVVAVRCTAANGTYGSVTQTTAGTSIPTGSVTSFPTDDADIAIDVIAGGTVGTAGIAWRYSLDGGTNWSPTQALGTAVKFVLEKGIEVNLAAGTLITGNRITLRAIAGVPTAQNITDALTALTGSALFFDQVYLATPATSTILTQLDTWLQAREAEGRYIAGYLNFRRRNEGETYATYIAAFISAFSAVTSTRIALGLDVVDIQSPIDSRLYARPVISALASRACAVDIARDASCFADGPLLLASNSDANSNAKYWDDFAQGGSGDDARAVCTRSWPGEPGVRLSNPRIFSPTGSDYVYLQHLRVVNRACKVALDQMRKTLSLDLITDPATGYIREDEAQEIEQRVNDALSVALVANRRASAASFTLSRTDNILQTFTLNGAVKVQPKGYPKTINVVVGLTNAAGT